MIANEIEVLAKQDGVLTESELGSKLIELKSQNFRILECIIYVKFNQDCSLNDAKSIVINSLAWIEQKEEFIQHQKEVTQEFLAFAIEDAIEIKMNITPEGTEYKIKK